MPRTRFVTATTACPESCSVETTIYQNQLDTGMTTNYKNPDQSPRSR